MGTLRECGVVARVNPWGDRHELYARAGGRSLLTDSVGRCAVGPVGRRPRCITLGPVLGAGHRGLWGTLRALDILWALEGGQPCPGGAPAMLPPSFPCVADEWGGVEAVGETGKTYMGTVFAERLFQALPGCHVQAQGGIVDIVFGVACIRVDLWGRTLAVGGHTMPLDADETHSNIIDRVLIETGIRQAGPLRRLQSPRGTNAQRYEYKGG